MQLVYSAYDGCNNRQLSAICDRLSEDSMPGFSWPVLTDLLKTDNRLYSMVFSGPWLIWP